MLYGFFNGIKKQDIVKYEIRMGKIPDLIVNFHIKCASSSSTKQSTPEAPHGDDCGGKRFYIRANSKRNTVIQEKQATRKRLAPRQAKRIPTANAAAPAHGDWGAERIAGKVITANVT